MSANQTQMVATALPLLQFCKCALFCESEASSNRLSDRSLFCLCVFSPAVMKSMLAHILSMDMESASGRAAKHCVRIWDNSLSKLWKLSLGGTTYEVPHQFVSAVSHFLTNSLVAVCYITVALRYTCNTHTHTHRGTQRLFVFYILFRNSLCNNSFICIWSPVELHYFSS